MSTENPHIRELDPLTTRSDTRSTLAHATEHAAQLEDYFLVDIDAHVQELSFWTEVIDLIDNDVIRQMGKSFGERGMSSGLLNGAGGMMYQSVYGRIPHGHALQETASDEHGPRQVQLVRRAMDAMGLDYQVVFPTAMLTLGMHPQDDVEVALARAFNRWLVERLLPHDDRIKALLYLPFNTPEACIEIVEQFSHYPGVIGYTICSTRNKPVHHNSYMKLYGLIEETGKPLAFHAGFHWGDPSFAQLNRFVSMHALSFVHYSLIHLTNWVMNGLPERFPKLDLVWVESGLAWVPYVMQRLDHEYLMRASEAPALKRLPSEYIREMYFTTQPLERTDMSLLQSTFKAINADTQLLFSSDWPHWDFDPPSAITSLPFLTEQAKRNILGLNAARLFNLKPEKVRPSAAEVAAGREAAK